MEQFCLHFFFSFHCPGWEYFFQCACPGFNGLFHGNFRISVNKFLQVVYHADNSAVRQMTAASVLCFCFCPGLHDRPNSFFHKICFFRRNLCNKFSKMRRKHTVAAHIGFQGNAQFISKCHFAYRCCNSFSVQGIGRYNGFLLDQLVNGVVQLHNLSIYRQIIPVCGNFENHQLIARLFQLRRNDILFFCHIHRKGNQCGRHVNFIKGS